MCGSPVLTPALGACLGGGATDACCTALSGSVASDADGTAANCFCHEAVLSGAKALLPNVEEIFDACAAKGVTVGYFGEKGDVCSCPAPATTTSTLAPACTPPCPGCSCECVVQEGAGYYTLPYPVGNKTRAVDRTIALASEDVAYDVLYGWEKHWTNRIADHAKQYKHISVAYLASSSVEDTIEDASESQFPYLVLGYALVIVYTVTLFAPFNPLSQRSDVGEVPPGPLAALAVVVSIALGTWAALGIAGAISTGDVKFNALTLQVVPFLALGLGVNDFLVLAQSLGMCYAGRAPDADAEAIIAETLRHGGVSVTLSSLTNTFAFLLGMLSGIPAVRAFALHIALAEVFNFLLTILVFPCILFVETRRFLAADASAGKPAPSMEKAKELAGARAKSISDFLDAGAGPAIRVFLLLASGGLLAFCAAGIPEVEVGLRLTDVIPKGRPLYDYAVATEDVYCSSPVYLTYREMDFPNIVQQSIDLNHKFVVNGSYMYEEYEVSTFLHYYIEYVEGQLQSNDICDWEVEYVHDPWSARVNVCEGQSDCPDVCAKRYQSLRAPEGKKCILSEDGKVCNCPYRAMLKPEHFYNITSDVDLTDTSITKGATSPYFEGKHTIRSLDKFMDSTINGGVSKYLTSQTVDQLSGEERSYGPITAARTLTFAQNVCSYDNRIKHIKDGRKIADAHELNKGGVKPGGKTKNVFPFDWIVYALTEQYLHIELQTLISLVICCVTVFVMMIPFVVNPLTSLVVTSVIVTILVELYGLIHWAGLKLNAVTMVNLLVAVGVAVELTAHVGREFMVSKGTRLERAVRAVNDMAWPLTNGALSTFVGIAAIALSDYEYFVNYFFLQYVIILAVGLWNGLIFLPSLLSLIGPPAYEAPADLETGMEKAPDQK